MANLTTKQTLTSLDKAEYLGQSTRTHKPTLSPKLTEAYAVLPVPAGQEAARMPDWDLLQDLNADLVEQSLQEVRSAGRDYRAKKQKATGLRRERRRVAVNLRRHHRELQTSFRSTYVDPPLDLIGLDVPPEERFVALREQCLETIDLLADEELASKLGEVRPGHAPLDLVEITTDMKAEVKRFEELYNAITEMKKVLDEALVAKREAAKRHRRIYANVARIQEGFYRLVGLDELADRIRVTIPVRRARSAEEEPAEDDAKEEASTQE